MFVDAECHERYISLPADILPLHLQTSRPDIVLIQNLSHDVAPMPYGRRRDPRMAVHLIEVGYTSDLRVHDRVQAKLDQHRQLSENFRQFGWRDVRVHAFIVGHTGVMRSDNSTVLMELGVPHSRVSSFLVQLALSSLQKSCGILSCFTSGPSVEGAAGVASGQHLRDPPQGGDGSPGTQTSAHAASQERGPMAHPAAPPGRGGSSAMNAPPGRGGTAHSAAPGRGIALSLSQNGPATTAPRARGKRSHSQAHNHAQHATGIMTAPMPATHTQPSLLHVLNRSASKSLHAGIPSLALPKSPAINAMPSHACNPASESTNATASAFRNVTVASLPRKKARVHGASATPAPHTLSVMQGSSRSAPTPRSTSKRQRPAAPECVDGPATSKRTCFDPGG